MASFYELFCPKTIDNKAEFNDSACHKIALETLKGKDPLTVLQEEISAKTGKIVSMIKDFSCSVGKDIPGTSLVCAKNDEAAKPEAQE